jgi:thioredoxin-like negative regulator of GroEL
MLDRLAAPLTPQVKFVKVNVDEAAALARRFAIEGIPTLLFFQTGRVVDRMVGLPAETELKARLEAFAKARVPEQSASAP